MGDPDRAIEFAQRALNVARALDDFALGVTANTYSGLAYYTRGEYRPATAFLVRNVEVLAGDAEQQRCELPYLPSVHSRAWLGCCLAELGAFPEAIVRADEAIRIAEGVNDPLSQAAAHFSRGQVHLRRGDFPNAVPALERALEVSREWNIELWFPTIAAALGSAYVLAGRVLEALPLLEAAVAQETLMKRIGSHSARLIALGDGYLAAGRLESASQVGHQALDLARGHGERGYQAWALRLLGEIAAHSGSEVSVARRHYNEAIELADSLEMQPLLGQCHFGLGSLYRVGGEPGLARQHLQVATGLFRTMAMPFWEGKTQREHANATTD